MALIHCHFTSKSLKLMTTMNVILPDLPDPGVRAAAMERGYPTLYLLHGRSDDHTAWVRRTSIERYVAGRGLAVVMPEVHRSYYADTVTGLRYWTFISEELPELARHYFPLSSVREKNFVAGLSMGGYGAFKLAMTYPERYAAAASLSGALDVVRMARADASAGETEFRNIFGSPDRLTGSPNDMFHLAEQLAGHDGPKPALYQWCGVSDFLHDDNRRWRDHAGKLSLPLTYEEGPGGHEWSCWDTQIQRVLNWLKEQGQTV